MKKNIIPIDFDNACMFDNVILFIATFVSTTKEINDVWCVTEEYRV